MKPILFNTQMVRAIQKGHKTVTRRIAFEQTNIRRFHTNEYPDGWWFLGRVYRKWDDMLREPQGVLSFAKYKAGDILYVRETWAEMPYGIVYRAEDAFPEGWDIDDRWKPSIHMPKEAARIFLRVKCVRVERLWDMTEKDALAEGVPTEWPMDSVYCPECMGDGHVGAIHPESLGFMEIDCPHCEKAINRFINLWNSTIKPADRDSYGWDANPWVWVIEFERCEKPKEVE